ncbi:hypothetical protein BKA62DRAFT_703221 [Auriculariales sp. MPI-PUGE-AT-0066]|nr:hypothetical protein BKA62DRAFT_703221 [Auriculariales sp. MPI-PUGE-AT-0066]
MEQKRRTSRRVAAQQDTSQHIQTGHELSVKWHHSPINNTLPPEVLHHICVLAAGINLISVHARRTLGYMRLVCQSWCRAASRLCHRRTVATTAVHARQLLEAVIQDTKKTTTIARTTFFAKDVTELILRSSAACDERVVVAAGQQLCVAVRRLTNLTALEWHMPARLPMECIRALAKYSKLTSLEMNDVRYNDFSDSVAQPCFPELANLVTLQRLTVRFGSNSAHWVCRSGGEWFKFCASLSALESLQHLAIEFTGAAYHVEVDSLCHFVWPDLRSLSLRQVRMYHGESFVSFLRQHPSLESLQLDSIFDWSCLRDAYFAAEGLARRLAVAFKDPTAAFLPALHTFSIESAGHLPSIPVLTEFICQIQTLRRISSVSTIHLGCFIDAPPASLPPSATPATQVVAVRLVAGSRNELNTCIMGSMKAFVNLESLHILVLAKSRVDVEEIWVS